MVAMELEARAQHAAALQLGIVLQEDEDDGMLKIVPPANSSIQSLLRTPADVARHQLEGVGKAVSAKQWGEVQVRACAAAQLGGGT